MGPTLFTVFFGAILAVVPATAAVAQTGTETARDERAVSAAGDFVAKFEEGDLGALYDQSTAPSFRALTARQVFVEQGGALRLQSGGRALARELVGAQAYSQLPNGSRGNYQFVRFRTRHPNGLVFQDVYLEDIEGQWKVIGFYLNPAPQQ